MRTARVVGRGAAYYHCMSRVIERKMLLDDGEKERFRLTIRKAAAYIDLNAVRVGLVEDPRDYRFCGYGEALLRQGFPLRSSSYGGQVGGQAARKGIAHIAEILGQARSTGSGQAVARAA